jgi:hypothetical protein
MSQQYPHTVRVRKDHNWWSDQGTWYEMSTWCSNTIGSLPVWEFDQPGVFLFQTEADKMLFLMRWGDHPVIKESSY